MSVPMRIAVQARSITLNEALPGYVGRRLEFNSGRCNGRIGLSPWHWKSRRPIGGPRR